MSTKQVLVRLGESDEAALKVIIDDVREGTGADISDAEAARLAIRYRAAKIADSREGAAHID